MSTPLPTLPGPSADDCCAPSTGLDPALDAARLARLPRELAAQADRSRQDVATNLERLRNRIADLPELLVRPDDVDYNARTDADDRALLDERLSQPAR